LLKLLIYITFFPNITHSWITYSLFNFDNVTTLIELYDMRITDSNTRFYVALKDNLNKFKIIKYGTNTGTPAVFNTFM
jgi:hypothetical protein